jgi:prepilin-type N-terminal cleavage/methylation domain-containing protein
MSRTTNAVRKGFTLIELLIVVTIISILSAIAIPQYSVYRKGAQDNAAEAAYHAVAMAQEAYFTSYNAYTVNYTEGLAKKAGLVKDQNVNYGPISLYNHADTNLQGFKFQVNHKGQGSSVYCYDSMSSVVVTKTTSGFLNSSTWN